MLGDWHSYSDCAGSAVHVGARNIIELPSSFVSSSQKGTDPLDVAAMVVPDDFVAQELRSPLPLDRTTAEASSHEAQMRCIYGFPASKNKTAKRADSSRRVFTAYGFAYAGASRHIQSDYPQYKKTTEHHVALHYQKDGRNEKGEHVTPPHPRGISGGGLWSTSDAFNQSPAILEGIAIEFHKDQSLVFSTRIEHVLSFIRERLPPGG